MLAIFQEEEPEVSMYISQREVEELREAGFENIIGWVGGYVPDSYQSGNTAV
jgi:hypothetical protein